MYVDYYLSVYMTGATSIRTCDALSCSYGARCVDDDGSGVASCVCPSDCDTDSFMDQVCGSNGRTYGSECQLRQMACRQQQEIRVLYVGPCTGMYLCP